MILIILRRAAAMGAFLLALGAGGQVVTYRFEGTVDSLDLGKGEGASLFGITGTPHAFSATFSFNLTAHPHVAYVPVGGTFEDFPAEHPFYLFPAASVVAGSVTVGTQTWVLADIRVHTWGAVEFSVFADSDLTTTPTLFRLDFEDGEGNSITLGSTQAGTTIEVVNQMDFSDAGQGTEGRGSFTISAVPEPSTYAAIAGACALVGVAVWRRRGTQKREAADEQRFA